MYQHTKDRYRPTGGVLECGPQWDQGARYDPPSASPRRPWAARTCPCSRSRMAPTDGPRRRCEGGGCVTALRAAGNGQHFQRTPPGLAEALAPPAAAVTRTQRPEPPVTVQPAATAAAPAGLGGGSVAALRRPYTCESAPKWLRHVRIGQAARLVQHATVTVWSVGLVCDEVHAYSLH